MQMLKENQGNSVNGQSYRQSKSIKTEGNFDDRRGDGNIYERNLTQQNESPIKKSQAFQQQPLKSGRSISCASQKSSQNTQRDELLGAIHSPNFAQNLEQISQRFEQYRNGFPVVGEHLVYDSQNVPVSTNLRQAFEQKLGSSRHQQQHQPLAYQTLMQQQQANLNHSRSHSINSNYSSINNNQIQNNMVSSQYQGSNNVNTNNSLLRKKIFENPLPPTVPLSMKNNLQTNNSVSMTSMSHSNLPIKGQPLNSSRNHLNSSSSNKENMNKNYPNIQHTSQFSSDEYSSITSNSNKEVDLDKANEKIQYLEQNLRREMLNSEEQRSQTAILKQELERKLNDGFMNFFKTSNSSHNLSHIDIYMELQVVKSKLLEKDEQLKSFQRDSDFQETLQIKERNKNLEQQNLNLKEQIELLRFDRNDLEDLKAEKSNLIEFIEKMKSENEKLEDDLANVEERFQNQKEDQSLKEQNDFLIEESRAKEQQIDMLNDQLSEMQLLREQIENHRLNLIEQNKHLNDEVLQLKSKLQQTEQVQSSSDEAIEEQHQLNEVLQEQVQSLKSEAEDNKNQFAEKLDEFEKIIEQLQAEKDLLLDNENKLQQEISSYQEQLSSFKQSAQSNTFIQNQFESYKQKFEDAKDNIFTLTQTLEETNNELQKVQTKCNNFEQIAKEKSTIMAQNEESIKQLNDVIQNTERENEYLKKKLQEELKQGKEKQAQQFFSEKRNLSLQLEHQKSQNMIQEKKIQELEGLIEKLKIELQNSQEESEEVIELKLKLQQNADMYEKQLKEMKLRKNNRRQDQVNFKVQVTMISDLLKNLTAYIMKKNIDDLEIASIIEDMEYHLEEIQNIYSESSQQQSVQITQRSSYQSLHQNMNMQLNNQYKSRDMEELKAILSMKDREILALKKDHTEQQQYQSGFPQQYQKIEKINRQQQLSQQQLSQQQSQHDQQYLHHGGYYSGKSSMNYFS